MPPGGAAAKYQAVTGYPKVAGTENQQLTFITGSLRYYIMTPIRVLICDDSALMRRSLKKIVESDSRLEVIATARDGEDAVNKARDLHPDVVTMDVNMPGMDGISALQIIIHEKIAPVLMVSSLTQEGALVTFEALALGAFDYIPKPGGTVSADMGDVQQEIIRKIIAAARPGVLRKLRRTSGDGESGKKAGSQKRILSPKKRNTGRGYGFKAVAIGISTGGPKTLFEVLPALPADLPAAVFVVQHMPRRFTKPFVERIGKSCAMSCYESEPAMEVKLGSIYLAKGGQHLILSKRPGGKIVLRTPKKPDTLFIPSVNVMMHSVLEIFGSDTVGILMTGMGDDGAEAMCSIRASGGCTIAESEESAIVFGMPRAAIEKGGVQIIAPSWKIADEIVRAVC